MDDGDYQSARRPQTTARPAWASSRGRALGSGRPGVYALPAFRNWITARLAWPHQAYCCATWSAGKPALGGCPLSPFARHSASSVSSVICPGPAGQADEKLPDVTTQDTVQALDAHDHACWAAPCSCLLATHSDSQPAVRGPAVASHSPTFQHPPPGRVSASSTSLGVMESRNSKNAPTGGR